VTWSLCSVGVFTQRKLQLISPNYRFNLKIVANAFVCVFKIGNLSHVMVILYKMCINPIPMSNEKRADYPENKLLTLSNIKYIIEGLDTLLLTDLDGEKRVRVIKLRDELVSYISSIFNDYS
jgi:hypothetical protein